MKRIGVFICHCGINIASTVDVKKVKEAMAGYPGVAHADDYQYLCSDPGQDLIIEAIKKKKLEGVIVAACSPSLHEKTFKNAAEKAGLDPALLEIANIREQCSWVHKDRAKATGKALRIIRAAVRKAAGNVALEPLESPVTKRALVIGGGISGMEAALEIAEGGFEVVLVEKTPSIGGHMAQLSETFPTLDCSQCILTPKMVEVSRHPRIKLYPYSVPEEITGYIGNFTARIKQKAGFVDRGRCTGCGICQEKCPVKVTSEFNRGLSERKAIYVPFPQAVPNYPVIDRNACLYFKEKKCGVCRKVCPVDAIDYSMKDNLVEEKVGAVVVATGYELYPLKKIGEYGAGEIPDVIDGLQFERLLSASGPTGGEIRRPSDGKTPEEVVFIQCAGSRDPETALPYCSRICCMYTAKHALLYKHRVPDGRAYVFYIDIRSGGKGYEEFVQKAVEEEELLYLRGKISRLFPENGKIVVWGADTLTGKKIEIAADLVVLAAGMTPAAGIDDLARRLNISVDKDGFLQEAHAKLRPVESLTSGMFLAGCAQAPRDIPETVAQAAGAASKVKSLLSRDVLLKETEVVYIDEDLCGGCRICIPGCPYKAIEYDETKKKAKINAILCEGCGSCAAACPSGAIRQKNVDDEQIYQMVEAVLEE